MGAYYAHFSFVLDSRVALHALQSKEILFRPWHHIKNVKNKIKKKKLCEAKALGITST